jgi:hypothetical protein
LCRAWQQQQLSDSIFGNKRFSSTLAGAKADADVNSASRLAIDVGPRVNQPPPSSTSASGGSQQSQSGHVRLAARLAERQRTTAVVAQVDFLQEQFSYLAVANTATAAEEDHHDHQHALESPFKVDQVLPVEGISVAEKNTSTNVNVVTIAPCGYDLEATLTQIATNHHHTRAFLILY